MVEIITKKAKQKRNAKMASYKKQEAINKELCEFINTGDCPRCASHILQLGRKRDVCHYKCLNAKCNYDAYVILDLGNSAMLVYDKNFRFEMYQIAKDEYNKPWWNIW